MSANGHMRMAGVWIGLGTVSLERSGKPAGLAACPCDQDTLLPNSGRLSNHASSFLSAATFTDHESVMGGPRPPVTAPSAISANLPLHATRWVFLVPHFDRSCRSLPGHAARRKGVHNIWQVSPRHQHHQGAVE